MKQKKIQPLPSPVILSERSEPKNLFPQRPCLRCGLPFTPKHADSRFCGKSCSRAWYQQGYNAARRGSTCEYNEAITCRTRSCPTCGWNPAVSAARIAEMKGAVKK